jgi:hypothetical protein
MLLLIGAAVYVRGIEVAGDVPVFGWHLLLL